MHPYGDLEIRTHLRQGLRERLPHALLVNELGIHRAKVRADVAVITPDRLVGYEIKSDKDSLARLPNQVKYYSKLFDQCYLICGEKYVDKVLPLVRHWWGVYAIVPTVDDPSRAEFRVVRDPKDNPKPQAWAVSRLFWREEMVDLLKQHNLYRGMSKANKAQLRKALLENFTRGELLAELYRYLPLRETWRIDM